MMALRRQLHALKTMFDATNMKPGSRVWIRMFAPAHCSARPCLPVHRHGVKVSRQVNRRGARVGSRGRFKGAAGGAGVCSDGEHHVDEQDRGLLRGQHRTEPYAPREHCGCGARDRRRMYLVCRLPPRGAACRCRALRTGWFSALEYLRHSATMFLYTASAVRVTPRESTPGAHRGSTLLGLGCDPQLLPHRLTLRG